MKTTCRLLPVIKYGSMSYEVEIWRWYGWSYLMTVSSKADGEAAIAHLIQVPFTITKEA